ncbi:DsbA family protein [Agromyces aerolatus]|uniref:DsbA family protein n=1 Tax=Agromyces sp. LY-1074 TaxID=3074080 RepID=UPI002860F22C|nr:MULTISPECIES: thioredoxin domain-containing protein [unclassified Agromyces]MDR5698225.1 thioredoxin domain-containing protein [Agromyces sp. LY-1074]MDR5704519.1 thioredoxin domain-containing protein [Agromyces sp. LY-1358]
MSNGGSNQPRPSRNDRREAAREKAKVLREQQKKKDRRKKVLIQGGVIVAVVAVAGLIGALIFNSVKPAGPGPANMASDGIVLTGADGAITAVETPALQPGEDPVPTEQDDSGNVANIVTYVDYLCPFCGDFESTNGETLRTLVESGAATVEVHPIAILSNKSAGTQYSLRAANAAACVADQSPESFFDYNAALFENQPAEGSTGLSNQELKALAAEVGVSSGSAIDACIDETRFKSWVQDATSRALAGPIPNSEIESVRGTPTVLVNGKSYSGSLTDASEFQAFVTQAASESSLESNDSTPTPTPTPAP